jgi:hypothetical protein
MARLTKEQLDCIRECRKLGMDNWDHWLDTIAALESDLKLERAAVLEPIRTVLLTWHGGNPKERMIDSVLALNRIESLISSADASALDKLLAEARTDEFKDTVIALLSPDIDTKAYVKMRTAELAALRAAPRDSGKAASQPTGTPEERER